MKKICSFTIIICLLISNVLASTTTYTRTKDNLQVASDIDITNSNINLILKTPKVNEEEKIYDFAELLTQEEENTLYTEINNYISNTNLDMAVVTIDDNNKTSPRNYADDFYHYNYFGKGTTHDGLLFLIDMDNREMWISTNGEAIIMYDDNRLDRILDKTYDKISQKDYDGCVSEFIDEATNYYNNGIPSSNKDAYINDKGDYIYNSNKSPISIFTFIIPLIISIIIVLIMKGRHKTIRKATTAALYMKEKEITIKEDTFLTSHTDKVYDPPSDSSGSSGGSSTHRSSSGRSSGGRGRSF